MSDYSDSPLDESHGEINSPGPYELILKLWVDPKGEFLHLGFQKEDLKIKIEDNTVILTARKKIEGSGYKSSASYEQRIQLPGNLVKDTIMTKFNADGDLIIQAQTYEL